MPNSAVDALFGNFLADRESLAPRSVDGSPAGLVPVALHTGPGPNGLEVLVVAATKKPTFSCVRATHKARRGNRASPVLIVAGYPVSGDAHRAVICGHDGEYPPCRDIELSLAERICAAALDEPTRHAAGDSNARLANPVVRG